MIDEILVHVSTPATRQKDEIYHSLANAYLEFEPHRVLQSQTRQLQHRVNQLNNLGIDSPAAPTSAQAPIDISVLSTSKDSYGSFPSYISSEDQATTHKQASTQQFGSSEQGSIPPSSRLARLEHIHTRWKKQKPPRSSFLEGQERTRQLLDGSDDADTAFIEDTQLAVTALQSQLQDTYSTTSEDTSEDESEGRTTFPNHYSPIVQDHSRSVDRSTLDGPEPASSATSAKCGTAIAGYGKTSITDDILLISNLPAGTINASKASPVEQKAVPEPLDFALLPIDAYPPAPEVSVIASGTLPSQLTKYLASIKAQNPNRFKLSKKLRSPKSDDRGYWLVKCSDWPVELQHEFWITLYEHVASGRLGWGTTLHRESASPQMLGLVKLYCWGEVVEHMWLVLWLCSKGKISGSGSRWFHADGIAALEVL